MILTCVLLLIDRIQAVRRPGSSGYLGKSKLGKQGRGTVVKRRAYHIFEILHQPPQDATPYIWCRIRFSVFFNHFHGQQ